MYTGVRYFEPEELQALLGEHDISVTSETDRIRADVFDIVAHPQYDHDTINYDFAVIKLSEPVDFALHPHIRPVCLPVDDSKTYTGELATISGWGRLTFGGSQPDQLQEITVEVVSNDLCRQRLSIANFLVTDQMICVNDDTNKTICEGDSGGPLVTANGGDGVSPGQNFEHIGATSWAYNCGTRFFPSGFARTTAQLQWIKTLTSGSPTCPRM